MSKSSTNQSHPKKDVAGDLSFDQVDVSVARRYIRIGYFVTLLFFGAIFSWAALVPISSAVIALGVVSTDGYRQTVQHLEGGIIHRILIKDGDFVTSGQELIELADVQSRSEFEMLQRQRALAAATEASLVAVQLDDDDVTLPDWLSVEDADPAVRAAISGQIESAMAAKRLHEEQLDLLSVQIDRARRKIRTLEEEAAALRAHQDLLERELEQYASIFVDGLVSREQVFDLELQVAENKARISSNSVAVQSVEQEIDDLNLQRSSLLKSHIEQVSSKLDSIREELVSLDEGLLQTADTLERTVIRASTNGVVVGLNVNTVGGVVSPGQPLLDIVPDAGSLIVDARLDPIDRDSVQVGLNAEIRFTAFNRRLTSPVPGRVTLISADRLIDPVTNDDYYQAKIELLEDPAVALQEERIFPGMQAEVLIVTGSRTALSYLTAPFIGSFNRAFRED